MTIAEPVDRVVGLDLHGRTAVVTGAASGIGRAVAVRLAAAGAHVLAVDLNAAAVEKVAADIGGDALAVDLAATEAIDAINLGGATIVVNSAGLQHIGPIPEFAGERYARLAIWPR